jgi:hypothetical protein
MSDVIRAYFLKKESPDVIFNDILALLPLTL